MSAFSGDALALWLGHVPVYLAIGALSGLVAGLFGVGGGVVIVPLLFAFLRMQSVSASVIPHLAIGSALACIVVTGASAAWAHHAKGAVRWQLFAGMLPGLLIGAGAGALTASALPGVVLQALFGSLLGLVAVHMFIDWRPALMDAPPGLAGLTGAGTLIAWPSTLLGIAGGSLTVPFLYGCRVPLHHAIGTASACGVPLAACGAVGYMLAGAGIDGLPAGAGGYVYWPAVLGIVVSSAACAPLGARLAHRWSVETLRRAFSLLLAVVSASLLWDAVQGFQGPGIAGLSGL